MPKTAEIYYCENCDFRCSKRSGWNAHVLTRKHVHRTALNQKTATGKTYVCMNCNKAYQAKNSLWYHKQRCNTILTTTPTNEVEQPDSIHDVDIEQEKEQEQDKDSTPRPAEGPANDSITTTAVLELIKHSKEMQNFMIEQQKEIHNLHTTIVEIAKKQGYVTTLLGRKCFVKDINHKNYTLRSFAERTAINARIQGTSADIMRKAMVLVDKFLRNNSDYDANIALQIHDELLVEVKENQAEELARILQVIMEQVFSFPIVLEVNYSIADNWHEAH